MPLAQSSFARRRNSAPQAVQTSRTISLRRLLATLALPIVGMNYLLIAGDHFRLPLICLFLVGAAVLGFLLAAGEATVGVEPQGEDGGLNILFTSSPDALFLIHPLTGQIVDCNLRALSLFEAEHKEDMVGAEFSSLQRVRLTDDKALEVLTATNAQGCWQKECAYMTRTGKEFWGDLAIKEFRRARESLVLARVADITDLKRKEEKAAKDKERVEAANAAKAEFLAELSQRMLLSVHGAIQTTDLVRDTQPAPEQQRYADFGQRAADALLTTVNDILDFGSIESGKLALEPIAFDLRTTLEESVERFAKQAEAKGVELTCLMSHEVPAPLWGDPGRLRQVFANIIENALACASPGDITVRGVITHRAPTSVTFRFSVTTPSFDLSQLKPLFQATQQSDVTARARRGEWLGLAVSKNLVKLLGGEMGVDHDPLHGGTVWFTVILEKQSPKALAAPPPRAHLHDIRALVVGESQATLHEQLVNWGIVSHSAQDADYAKPMLIVAAEVEAPYELILVNSAEISQNILSFVHALRENPMLAALRIVLLTAAGTKGDAQRAHQSGVDAYLTKPVSQSLLFECLATLMNQPPKTVAPNTPLVTRYTLAETRAHKRLRVLVVENDLTAQKLAARLLTQLGYRVDIAVDGEEGVEAHANISYAAVLIASALPRMNGLVTAAEIRQRDREEQTYTPTIGLIGTDGTTYEQCLEAGMDDALVQPLSLADLKTALDRRITRTAPIADETLADSVLVDEVGFDLNEALARVDGDQEFLNEIVTLFLQDHTKYLDELRAAIARHDPQAVTFSANSLRGLLSNFAATPAANAALRLENLGRQGDLSTAPSALAQLEEAIAQLQPALASVVTEKAA